MEPLGKAAHVFGGFGVLGEVPRVAGRLFPDPSHVPFAVTYCQVVLHGPLQGSLLFIGPLFGDGIRGTLGDIDPLDKVPV